MPLQWPTLGAVTAVETQPSSHSPDFRHHYYLRVSIHHPHTWSRPSIHAYGTSVGLEG